MKFSPAAVASLVAFFAASATAAPTLETAPTKVDFYKASGMAKMIDGLYSLDYDATGEPVITYTPHNKDSSATSAASVNGTDLEEGSLSKRGQHCDNIKLDPAETDAANADLQKACQGGYSKTIWSQIGNTVAYYCQYKTGATCWPEQSNNANYWITKSCGKYWAGSYQSAKHEYAYGYTRADHEFCGVIM